MGLGIVRATIDRYKKACADSTNGGSVSEANTQYRAKRKDTYTQKELDEVREEWAAHVLEWLFY